MTKQDAKKLKHGVYRLFWKEGGSSLASIGCLYNGTPWFAPSNWVSPSSEGIACTKWNKVEYAVIIEP